MGEVGGEVGWREDAHAGDKAVDMDMRDGELVEHAKRDGAAAGLGARRVALEEERLRARRRQRLGRRRARGPPPTTATRSGAAAARAWRSSSR